MKLLLQCAALTLVACSLAHAQEAAKKDQAAQLPSDNMDTVEVVGRHGKLGQQVLGFVSTLTRLDGEFVSRWDDPICPQVAADDEAQAAYIRQRLLEIAAGIPVDVASDTKCDANLFVVLSNEPAVFIAEWQKRDPGMFIWRPRRGVSRSDESLPVRTWHNVGIGSAIGAPVSGGDLDFAKPMADQQLLDKASRIESNWKENLTSVMVLVDTNAAAGVTLRQLADYIAMVSFTKVDVEADLGQTPTVLRLFSSEGSGRPAGLTAWDDAFLRGVYRQNYSAIRQRGAIAVRMLRELDPQGHAKP
jgi:hypothetical protein